MSTIELLIWLPSVNILFKSVPKILMAMFALVPESMWSMRCPSGCPTVAAIPGIRAIVSRTSAINSSRLRSSSLKFASISALFTVCECSSNSPRPVLLAVLSISSIVNNSVSTKLPRRLLSSNEVPGWVTTDKVREPSLNSGKKLRPIEENTKSETINMASVERITRLL